MVQCCESRGGLTLEDFQAVLEDTLEDVYEPFLMQLGFLSRTPRGRVVTQSAYQHLGLPYSAKLENQQSKLWTGEGQ